MAVGKTRPPKTPPKLGPIGGASDYKSGEKSVTRWYPVGSGKWVSESKKLARRANEACLWCYCACACAAIPRKNPATNVTLIEMEYLEGPYKV